MEFISHINNAFDILNSRNHLAKGTKAPISQETYESHAKKLKDAKVFLLGVRECFGSRKPMHCGQRKTGFIGLVMSMRSFLTLYEQLVLADHLPSLLAYKFSQDHLELFFSAIRSCGGFNNNPSARQFKAAYRRLLMRHQVKNQTGFEFKFFTILIGSSFSDH